jgi:hypothetical protein
MNITVNHESVAKRRLVIAAVIVPYTVFVALNAARLGVLAMWRSAAFFWRA